ncbi:MAG TPA: aminotransferase class V-fold PLP-dependent enzyme, partial [Spirochaetales bacterium]|nr:aminotransferase class V-fold PLP-dependent enzyme [Spirochaetales bacterium]
APLVVTSSYEHNAVMRPLRWLEKHRGVKVFVLPFDEAGLPDEEALEHALCLKPDLAVFTMASNVTGVVLPWEELSWQFHRAGSLVCLDGSQYIGHFPFDMSVTCADFLCFPGHKGLLGPTGIGALYLAGGPLPEPLVMGGTGSHSLSEEQPAELPDRFEAGTQNLAGAAGLLHAVNFVASVGLDAICEREAYLTNRLIAGLSAISGIRVYGPGLIHSERARSETLGQTEWKTDGMTSHRTGDRTDDQTFRPSDKHAPVVSFLPENLPLDIFAAELDKRGVVARHGLHCAPEAHRTIGSVDFGGTVRFSPGYFTTEQEIDEALSIVEQISRHC